MAATPIMPEGCKQKDLRTAQLTDADIAPVLQAKQADQRLGEDKLKVISLASRRLVQLYMGAAGSVKWHPVPTVQGPMGREERLQVVATGPLRNEVLTDQHEGELGGYLGIALARLKERFYWLGHYQDVQN